MFARNMGDWLKEQGVTFKFGTTITGFETEGDRITAVMTDKGRETADVVVLCLGVYSPHLAQQIGHDLPIYPVKGYAITAPMAGRNNPPTIGGVDEETLVAYAPYGDRMRVTATAEFSGYGRDHRAEGFRDHARDHEGPVPRWRRLERGQLLGGPPADDAGRNAHPRPLAHEEPVVQHRPGPHGLDDEPRRGADHRRSHRRKTPRRSRSTA